MAPTAQVSNQPQAKRSLATKLKSATPMLLSVVAAALLAGPAAQAAVFSTTAMRADAENGIVAAFSVRCTVSSDPLVILQKQQDGQWCSKDSQDVCATSKLSAAERACYYRARGDASASSAPQLAKTEAPKAAPVEAAPKSEVAVKAPVAKKAASNNVSLEKDKLSIEAKRIAIEQQKLNLRKEELELQKQELSLKQASTEM